MESRPVTSAPVSVRTAATRDAARIPALIRSAFTSSKLGYHGEDSLVEALQRDGDALLSLVAEIDGVVIGHAMFSRMMVCADDGEWKAAALAPLSVQHIWQRQGIGGTLIREGIDRLRVMGTQIVFVLGHPGYYPRFGFDPMIAAPFASPFAGPHFMAQLLDKSLQIPKSGRADYAAAFSR
jgi:putative acetyltransferase